MRPFSFFCRFILRHAVTLACPVIIWFGQTGRVQAQENPPSRQLYGHRPDSVYQVLKTRLDQAIAQNDRLAEGDAQQELGTFFYHQGNYSRAIELLISAQKLFRATDQTDRLANNLNQLGTVYYYNRQSALARKQFDEALTLYRQLSDSPGIARTYGQIGHLYEKQGNLDQAFRYQKLALAQVRSTNEQTDRGKIYENIGSIFEDRAQYDSAHYYYEAALTLAQQHRDEVGQLEIINNLGDIFRKTNRYGQALNRYRQVVRLANEQGERYQLNSAYRDLGKTFQLMNQHDSAYQYFELSHDLTDEIYAASNTQQITLLQTLYEVERKDNEIAQLNAENRLSTLLSGAGSLVLLLLAGLGAVIISRQRLKIRNERALSEQNQQILRTQNELMQVELQNKQLASENLTYQLELKSKELTSHTLHLIQKNQVLEELRDELATILKDDKRDQRKQLKQLANKINESFSQDKNWDDFRTTFEQVHPNFFSNLTRQFPDLTSADLRLIALLKMNMNSTDMATLLGISSDSLRVARYRLRKKLGMAEGESLSGFVQRRA